VYRKLFKRLFDIIASMIAFPFFLVLIVILSPFIYFSDKGTIFYNAERLGKNGKVFKMYKFRTMKMNVPDLRNEDGSTFNSESDNRLTKIGKFIRKTSIDEIPQILNVLIGNMSIIGPRPDMPDAIKLYKDEFIDKLKVKPGLTGYNQAYFRNSADIITRFKNDCYYANNYNWILDLKIIFKTIQTVILGRHVFKK